MPDTPAPALTDEEIDYDMQTIEAAACRGMGPEYAQWVRARFAAVIAKARREAAERIAGELEAAATGMGDDLDDYGVGQQNGFRLAARRAEGGAGIARQIGADHG